MSDLDHSSIIHPQRWKGLQILHLAFSSKH
jgi:hypothetical protein